MKLRNFEVMNYKCHKHTILQLSDFHVLLGKNNSGKTSILECFKLLKDFFGKSLEPVDLRPRIFGNVNDGEVKELAFNLEAELADDERDKYIQNLNLSKYTQDKNLTSFFRIIRMEFKIINTTKPVNPNYQNILFISSMSISYENSSFISILKHLVGSNQLGFKRLDNIHPETMELNKKTLEEWIRSINDEKIPFNNFNDDDTLIQNTIVKNFLNQLFFIGAERNVEKIYRPPVSSAQKEKIFDDLVKFIHICKNNNENDYDKIKNFGKRVQPDIDFLSTEIEHDEVTLRFTKGYDHAKFKTLFSEQGKGVENTLIFATYLSTSPVNSIWFIDEPELHQHPESQNNLYQLFMELVDEGRQIIVSTQSMIFAHKSQSDQITLFSIDNSNEARAFYLDSFLSLNDDLLDSQRNQIYTYLGYNPVFALEPRIILLVEGKADKEILTIFAETLQMPINTREVKIVPLQDKVKVEKYSPYISRAVSGKKVIITLDNDDKKPEDIKKKILELEKTYADYLKLNPVLTDKNFHLFREGVISIEYYLLHYEAICRTSNKFDVESKQEVKKYIELELNKNSKPKEILKSIWQDILKQGSYDEVRTAVEIARNIPKDSLENHQEIITLIKELTS